MGSVERGATILATRTDRGADWPALIPNSGPDARYLCLSSIPPPQPEPHQGDALPNAARHRRYRTIHGRRWEVPTDPVEREPHEFRANRILQLACEVLDHAYAEWPDEKLDQLEARLAAYLARVSP